MYFSIRDKGHFASMVYNWQRDVDVIVVTDGSRILVRIVHSSFAALLWCNVIFADLSETTYIAT